MSDIFYFTLNGKKYPAREVEYWGETMTISTEALDDALFDERGQYASKTAQYIDEKIFFFVCNDDIYKSKKELQGIMYDTLGDDE